MAKWDWNNLTNIYDAATLDTLNERMNALSTLLDTLLSRDGTAPNAATANIDFNSNRAINLATPVDASDAATKSYVDSGGDAAVTVTWPLDAPNGSESAPSYSFANGLNYGMWFDTTSVELVGNSHPGVRVISDGDVTLGQLTTETNEALRVKPTSSQVNRLEVEGTVSGSSPVIKAWSAGSTDADVSIIFDTRGAGKLYWKEDGGTQDLIITESYLDNTYDPIIPAGNVSGLGAMALVADATNDGNDYVRNSLGWTLLDVSFGDISGVVADNSALQAALDAKADSTDLSTYLEDAAGSIASDNLYYARRNGSWQSVTTGSGIGEAPIDGTDYVRRDAGWVSLSAGLSDAPADGSLYARKDNAWESFTTSSTGNIRLNNTIIESNLTDLDFSEQFSIRQRSSGVVEARIVGPDFHTLQSGVSTLKINENTRDWIGGKSFTPLADITLEFDPSFASDSYTENITITSLTSSGTTCTVVTANPHNLTVDAPCTITGAIETDYNGTFTVASVISETSFTYVAGSTPSASPATGSPLFKYEAGFRRAFEIVCTLNVAVTLDEASGTSVTFRRTGVSGSLTLPYTINTTDNQILAFSQSKSQVWVIG